jgi:hypothetical protein
VGGRESSIASSDAGRFTQNQFTLLTKTETMDSATRFSNHLRNVGLVIALGVLVLLAAATSRAQAEQPRYPIKADDGSPVANTRVPAELANAIEQCPAR